MTKPRTRLWDITVSLKTTLIVGRMRIALCVFGLAAVAVAFASAEVVHADQLVGVNKGTNLIGKQVKNFEGKDLGTIQDLVVNWRGGGLIEYAVLSFGGFLGMGDKYFAVPWEAMILSGANEHFLLNVKEERLKNAPGFDKDRWPDMSNRDWALVIYQFYGLDPSTAKSARRSSSAEVSQMMKGELTADFTNRVREALNHALQAESAGKQGKAEALVSHAKKSLDYAKQAQRQGLNERLNEGVYALGEAIEHGGKRHATDATKHIMDAIMKLSQSAGLQLSHGEAAGH